MKMPSEFIQGADYDLRFQYKLNGIPYDLTDCTVHHTWKKSKTDTVPALHISKTEHESLYETVLKITPELTNSLALGTYYHDFVIVTAEGRVVTDPKMQGHHILREMLTPLGV